MSRVAFSFIAVFVVMLTFASGCELLPSDTGDKPAAKKTPKGPFVETPATTYSDIKTEQVRKVVVQSLTKRGWRVTANENEVISASILVRTHTADIRIPYGGGKIQVNYVSSTNLKYNPETQQIHPTYNKWVTSLINDINVALSQIKFGS